MFCEKCGAQNPDNSKFCEKCGAPMTPIAPAETPKAAGKPLNPKVIIGLIVAAALIIGGVYFVNLMGKTIDLNKYVSVETEGYNGYGKAMITVDWDAIEEKYGDKISYTEEGKKKFKSSYKSNKAINRVEDAVSIKLEKRSGLTNGDKIEYTWDVNSELEKYYDVKLKYKNDSITIEGLEEIETFDAFADVEVTFSGLSPVGRADVRYVGSDGLNGYFFNVDKYNNLKNGDTIEVSINEDYVEDYIRSYGKKPAEKSKTYTVSGLSEYIASFDALDADFVAEIKKETEDSIASYVAKSYSDKASLSNLEYAGYIFETVSNTDYISNSSNGVYIIYKGDVSHSEGLFNTAKVYYPVFFNGLVKEDGKTTYNSKSSIYGYSNLDGRSSTNGYINPLVCYLEVKQGYNDNYTLECGGDFASVSKYSEVTAIDGMSVDFRNATYIDAQARIDKYVADNYNETSKLTDVQGVGEILLSAKNPSGDFRRNTRYIIVFEGNVSSEKNYFEPTKVYFPVEYDGVYKYDNGEYTLLEINGILGNSNLPGSWYYTKGYTEGKKLYSDIVTANRDYYNFEVTEGIVPLETEGSESEE